MMLDRMTQHLEGLARDIGQAVRQLPRDAGFVLTVVLSLGLAAAANAICFAVVNAVFWKPLPYASGDELVMVRQSSKGPFVPPGRYKAWKSGSATLDELAAFTPVHGS